MKKPTLVKDIVILITLNILFFGWFTWVIVSGDTTDRIFVYLGLFIVAEMVYVVGLIKQYKEAYKRFEQNIKLMGMRSKIIDYEVKEIKSNNGSTYFLTTKFQIAGKEHTVRKHLSKEVALVLRATKPVLDLYTDPSSTKFIYHLDTKMFLKL